MADLSNISILDHEEISDFIFINRDNWNSPQESSEDHLIEIDNNASINARFYFKNPDRRMSPCIFPTPLVISSTESPPWPCVFEREGMSGREFSVAVALNFFMRN